MLKIYNTLTRKKEVFKPLKGKRVKVFCCGPTVYDDAHLGHAKTYVQVDVLVKYLRYKKYKVFYLQNITDVDDKIIKRAAEKNLSWREVGSRYEASYLEDMKRLGVNSVNKYARATEYIGEIVSQVERLIKKGVAYEISDGYYFDLKKFKGYGKLAKRMGQEQDDAVSRIDENAEKRNKGDFCLWKFSKPGEPAWETRIGAGRPGWHVEDTAITEKELGQQYDLHGGGMDLIFPHHEAEIAQMESLSGKVPFVKYWVHIGFLKINKEKMSKSLGNFWTIKDVLQKYDPKVLRFFLLSTHYRGTVDVSEQSLLQAKNSLQRVHDFVRMLEHYPGGKAGKKASGLLKKTEKSVEEALDDNLETARAFASIFELIREANILIAEKKLSKKQAKDMLTYFKKLDAVFGILKEKEEIPSGIQELVAQREKARKSRQWQEADRLRQELRKEGYLVEDTAEGPVVKKF